ncbi:hypothetical protein [Fervidicoccus fontis]|nr:hypothetical protein [Fervidicoccus fontis]
MGKKRAISTIAIIGIVIVIAVIGIVAYYAMENRGGTSQQQPPQLLLA